MKKKNRKCEKKPLGYVGEMRQKTFSEFVSTRENSNMLFYLKCGNLKKRSIKQVLQRQRKSASEERANTD